MDAQQVRQAYLNFFEAKGHKIIPRAKLVPNNDPTTLFTGSGMQPLIPYLLGENHPDGNRLVNSQTCLRSQDIEEIGDNRHTTFFEMLGNWSLGDYFKNEQIPWLFDFLVNHVKLDPNKLYVSCYIGNEQLSIPKDTESAELWQKEFKNVGLNVNLADIGSNESGYNRGIKESERIFFYDGSKNWWSRSGNEEHTPIGDPCGPDSEVFYEFENVMHDRKWGENCHLNCDCGRFIEIANSVFMSYKRTNDGFIELEKPNVDFGGGLERISVAAINDPDVFKISLIKPIIDKLSDLSNKNYDNHTESMRVIADHLRAATFLAVDGVIPSNKEQGYVLRRLIRRAIRYAFELGIEQNFMVQIVPVIADLYHKDYPEVAENREKVIQLLSKEEKIFRQTLRNGLREFSSSVKDSLSGELIFKLYDTFGFPNELSKEEAFKNDILISDNADEVFNNLMNEQKLRSQTAAKGVFKGGLGGDSLIHKKYHTATHLMYQALRQVLGDQVVQRGSNITEERLRFDFSYPSKMTPEQIKQVEDEVNEKITQDLKVSFKEYTTEEAFKLGAVGQFGDKYGDKVKVYSIAEEGKDKPYSFEICGGPHVERTAQLGEDNKKFKIIKEESTSSGVRRIKAVLI